MLNPREWKSAASLQPLLGCSRQVKSVGPDKFSPHCYTYSISGILTNVHTTLLVTSTGFLAFRISTSANATGSVGTSRISTGARAKARAEAFLR